jgi:hypothetical protein
MKNIGNICGLGPLGLCAGEDAFAKFTRILTITITLMTICAGIWFMMQIFTAAYQWLISNGDKQAVETSRKKITNSAIGLFLVVFSYAFVSIAGSVLGIQNILSPAAILSILKP